MLFFPKSKEPEVAYIIKQPKISIYRNTVQMKW